MTVSVEFDKLSFHSSPSRAVSICTGSTWTLSRSRWAGNWDNPQWTPCQPSISA